MTPAFGRWPRQERARFLRQQAHHLDSIACTLEASGEPFAAAQAMSLAESFDARADYLARRQIVWSEPDYDVSG